MCIVNLGDDADTVGAIYGQLAGAYYRVIPQHWIDMCTFNPLITLFANELLALSASIDIMKTNNQPLSHDMCKLSHDMLSHDLIITCHYNYYHISNSELKVQRNEVGIF